MTMSLFTAELLSVRVSDTASLDTEQVHLRETPNVPPAQDKRSFHHGNCKQGRRAEVEL